MDIEKATAAGDLAAKITAASATIATIGLLKQHGESLSGALTVYDDKNGIMPLALPPLTKDESAAIFDAATVIFQARLDALNAQLASL